MAFSFSKPRPSPIAIDFGSEQLKLLQLIPGQPAQLVAAAAVPVPAEARQDAASRQKFLAEALPKAIKSQRFKGRRVICSLPAFQTLVQNLEISGIEQGHMSAAVADQLRQRMNVDPARMVIRHHHAGQITRNGSTLQQVLCLAASRDLVMQYVELCNNCRLDLVGMHSEPMAIVRAFEHLHPADADKPVCYIDLGAATTKLVIAHGASVVFAKTVHAAGDHMQEAATEARAAQHMEAGIRSQQQLASTPDGQAHMHAARADAATGDDATQADGTGLAMLNAAAEAAGEETNTPTNRPATHQAGSDSQASDSEETVECLIDELQMCLRYHRGLFPKRPVQKLVFLGGVAHQVQTCQRIARAVRVAAQLGDPLAGMTRLSAAKPASGVDMEASQPAWAVPFGLCHSEANL